MPTKEDKRVVALDTYEEGAVITALNDMRNNQIKHKESTEFVDDLMLKVMRSPQRKVRMRDEAR